MVIYPTSCGCSAVWTSWCSFSLLRWVFIKWRCVVRCERYQVDQTCAKVSLAWLNWSKLCFSAGCLTKLIPLGLKRLKRWWSAKHLSAPPICCNLVDVMVCFVEVNVVFSNAKMPGPSACVPRGPVWEPCDAWLMCPVLNNLNDAYISLPVRLVISNMNMVKTAKQHRSVAVCQTDWRCGTNV